MTEPDQGQADPGPSPGGGATIEEIRGRLAGQLAATDRGGPYWHDASLHAEGVVDTLEALVRAVIAADRAAPGGPGPPEAIEGGEVADPGPGP